MLKLPRKRVANATAEAVADVVLVAVVTAVDVVLAVAEEVEMNVLMILEVNLNREDVEVTAILRAGLQDDHQILNQVVVIFQEQEKVGDSQLIC